VQCSCGVIDGEQTTVLVCEQLSPMSDNCSYQSGELSGDEVLLYGILASQRGHQRAVC